MQGDAARKSVPALGGLESRDETACACGTRRSAKLWGSKTMAGRVRLSLGRSAGPLGDETAVLGVSRR